MKYEDLDDKIKYCTKIIEKTEKIDWDDFLNTYQDIIDAENEVKKYNKLKYPLCIPSCRNRQPSLLQDLDKFGDSEIYVFNYENEVDLYKWLDKPNVNKITVPLEYLSIQKMRQFIQNYMGDKIYWVSDDDIKFFYYPWKLKELDVFSGFKIMEILIDKYFPTQFFSAISPTHLETGCRFFHKELFKYGYASQVCLFNGKICNDIGLKYTGDKSLLEDMEFVINSWKCGIPVQTTRAFLLKEYFKSGDKNSIASSKEKMLAYTEGTKEKLSEYVKVTFTKHGKVPTVTPKYKKLLKDFPPKKENNEKSGLFDFFE